MSLPINPQAALVSRVAGEISQAASEAKASFIAAASELNKANLDSKVSRLSGELNSGLNGLSAGLGQATSALGNISSVAQTGVNGIVSGVAGAVGDVVGGVANTVQSVVGTTSNIVSDISGSLQKLGAGSLASGLQGFADSISKSAGMLNDILSLTRGASLPAGAELFTAKGESIKLEPNAANDWRVKINCQWPILGNSPMFQLLENTGGVVFPYTPTVHIGTKANYTQIDPTHSMYPFQSYKNSTIDAITIMGDFSAETEIDAAYWLAATTFFKTATKMFFGQGGNVGNPPIICRLSGYGPNIFPNVPVVITSFEVEMSPETDYIKCELFGSPTWVPVKSTINVSMMPVYSRSRQRQFSLQDYAKGKTISSSGIGWM